MNEDAKNYLSNEVLPSVKALANQKIIAILPSWKQANFTARMTEINFDAQAAMRPFTALELAEVEAMRVYWLKIKAVRTASDIHETALQSLITLEEVCSYDYRINWPEV